jgi:hypothetical protein
MLALRLRACRIARDNISKRAQVLFEDFEHCFSHRMPWRGRT